jgi:hypothetical protein
VLDQPATRRLRPVLIVFLVLLAVAAGTVGYFGARRVLGIGQGAATPTTTAPGSVPGPSSGQTPGTTPQGGPDAKQPEPQPRVTVPPGDPTRCPDQTRDALATKGLNEDLAVVFYIRATLPNAAGAEVWICRNADGLLIYQGHRLTGPITETDHSLLLAEGIRGTVEEIEGGYLATNPTSDGKQTTYTVTPRTLTVINPGGRTTYTVVVVGP